MCLVLYPVIERASMVCEVIVTCSELKEILFGSIMKAILSNQATCSMKSDRIRTLSIMQLDLTLIQNYQLLSMSYF